MLAPTLLVRLFFPRPYCSRIGKEGVGRWFLYLALFISVYTWCAPDWVILFWHWACWPLQLRSALVLVFWGTWAKLIGLEKEAAPLILRIDVSDVVFYSLEAPA